ncbi:hypothetical protein ACFE04_008605 [Oxalis oulophora]
MATTTTTILNLKPTATTFHHHHHSLPHITTTIRCGAGPRSQRGPLVKGRILSIEAIQAIQTLKRLHKQNPSTTTFPFLSRLLKSDILATLNELLRQDLCSLALPILSTIRTEYPPINFSLYADVVNALSRNKLYEDIDRLIDDLEGEEGGFEWGDDKGLVRLVKGVVGADRKESTVKIVEMMKRSGCGDTWTADYYLVKVLSKGLKRFGEQELGIQVEREFGWVGKGRLGNLAVDGGGNAARAGLKADDQVLYTSSFFGDELWPADKLGFTKTAIQAKPDSVYFVVTSESEACVVVKCFSPDVGQIYELRVFGINMDLKKKGADVNVKRLPKRPAPPRFGRKLTDSQKERATHLCLDCGYIYFLPKPFEEQPEDYVCPQCRAPKKRFVRYDPNTGKTIGGGLPPIGVIIGLLAGIAGVGALLVYGLQ